MRTVEIEAWARRVVDRVLRGGPIEDSRVELKNLWPSDPNKAARRIAGHCNANAGETLLWLIGVDENNGVVGVNAQEMSTWWASVRTQFEGQVPVLQDVVIEFGGRDVVALVFEADRAPFVVLNPAYGKKDGGPVNWEVPWRDGTAVRSATRADLLRLLIPARHLPTIDVIDGRATLSPPDNTRPNVWVSLTLYAVLEMGNAIVLPNHQAAISVRIGKGEWISLDPFLGAQRTSRTMLRGEDSRLHTVHQGDEQVIFEGPGFFRISGKAVMDEMPDEIDALEVSATIRPAGNDVSISIRETIPVAAQRPIGSPEGAMEWKS